MGTMQQATLMSRKAVQLPHEAVVDRPRLERLLRAQDLNPWTRAERLVEPDERYSRDGATVCANEAQG